jgi:hypothetical protein
MTFFPPSLLHHQRSHARMILLVASPNRAVRLHHPSLLVKHDTTLHRGGEAIRCQITEKPDFSRPFQPRPQIAIGIPKAP